MATKKKKVQGREVSSMMARTFDEGEVKLVGHYYIDAKLGVQVRIDDDVFVVNIENGRLVVQGTNTSIVVRPRADNLVEIEARG